MSEFGPELIDLVRKIAVGYTGQVNGVLATEWTTVCELGLSSVGIAEASGGSGGTVADLAIVIRELAKAGIGTPIVEASTAAWALGEVSSGTDFDTVAVAPNHVLFDGEYVSGTIAAVRYGHIARRILLLLPGAGTVVVVESEGPGVSMSQGSDVAGHPTSRVDCERAPAHVVKTGRPCDQVRARLAMARATALVGSGQGAYLLARDHVRTREQFGGPLVRIPAVAEGVARMWTSIQEAESAITRALHLQIGDGHSGGDQLAAAAVARVVAADMATFVARQAHQLHGALGVTEEYPLHRFTRNLWAWRDADESAVSYSTLLGDMTLRGGEDGLWHRLSA